MHWVHQIALFLLLTITCVVSQVCNFPQTWQGELTSLDDDWTFADSTAGPEAYYVDKTNNRFRVDSNSIPTSVTYSSMLYLGNKGIFYLTNATLCEYWMCSLNNISFPWDGYLSGIPGISLLGNVLVGDTQASTYGTPNSGAILLAVVTSDTCLPISLSFIDGGVEDGLIYNQFFNVYNEITDDSVFTPNNQCVVGPSSENPCSDLVQGYEGSYHHISTHRNSFGQKLQRVLSPSSVRSFSRAFKKFR